MPEVDRYRIVFYGSSADNPTLKAKVELYAQSGDALASIGKLRFHSGEELPPDEQKKGRLSMNLPVSELNLVVETLRSERPIYFSFHEGRAVLGTGIEPIGSKDELTPRLVHVVENSTPQEREKLEEPTSPPSD